jgi:hypothetical protein
VSREHPEIRALKWVKLPDGRVGIVMLVEFWRGVYGADIAIPGVPGRAWAPLSELVLVNAPVVTT